MRLIRHHHCRSAAIAVALGMILGAGPAAAGIVKDPATSPPADARAVFELVKQAFESGDQQVLADLVHADGLRVKAGGPGARDTDYSPSQAFYYFKNLFQARRTVTFEFARMTEAPSGDRVHALAQWTHRRSGRDEDDRWRLVIVLSRQGDAWRLAEITTIG